LAGAPGVGEAELDKILISEVCQRFGWTIQEYDSQPQWFIDLIVERMIHEAEEAKRADREAKQHNGNS